VKIEEFTKSAVMLLANGVYYYEKTKFEDPLQVKHISDKAIMVEFFNPEDTFLITIERRDESNNTNES